ncbi:hypothetical protein SAMN05428974_0506 [Sphingopyxis sp. YR583]|uniref:hypothetical protein n=1 Tax=Sphingopyxis sp. YR583 TaxID=1881047 RepID=UPI0008A78FF8|nr:hypothetical protein [Sphingopyxis sp. YR583]SEH12574.1 hypothetical protein SAMN05428974_0506 [Sphingopyxis sp. YR583]
MGGFQKHVVLGLAASSVAGLFLAAQTAMSQQASDGLPEQSDLSYQGSYELTASDPSARSRPTSLRNVISGSGAKRITGALTFNLERRGAELNGTMIITGGSPTHNRVTGTYQDGRCKLFTNETVHEGTCNSQGFSGQISSTGAITQKVEGRFTTSPLKIVDVDAQERALTQAAKEKAMSAPPAPQPMPKRPTGSASTPKADA